MPSYLFIIDAGPGMSDTRHRMELSDHSAAWDEAVSICRELHRDIGCIQSDLICTIDVEDSQGTTFLQFTFMAGTLVDRSMSHWDN